MGSATAMSTKYRHHHCTHCSRLPELHKMLSHILFGPLCGSFGKSKGVSQRWIFLNITYCCPSLQRATNSFCWLQDLLLTPALALPTTWWSNAGCMTQHFMLGRRGIWTQPKRLLVVNARPKYDHQKKFN